MSSAMRTALALVTLLPLACGDNTRVTPGPYDDVDLTEEISIEGLTDRVHIVRDEFGIAHISASNLNDLGVAQGYVMARDRIAQMDILRRFGSGTLAELFGALDASIVESDLEMRVHRLRPIAEEAYRELSDSGDPFDAKLVTLLDGFAIGVNAYVGDLSAGRYELDPEIEFSFDAERFEPWTAIDSLVLGRFQAFSLSFNANQEVTFTRIYDKLLGHFDEAPMPGDAGFDEARHRRRGAAGDIVTLAPVGRVATRDGFPNVETDSGTSSDGKRDAPAPLRPRVPAELLDRAERFFAPKMAGIGPHSFRLPEAGSNNWAVGPAHADGKAMLAGDQHLVLPNPSIFYPTHLVIPGEIDVEGITFPGIPGVILGHNGNLAWTSTVVAHDANDVYLEEIVPCSMGGSMGGGDCVVFEGGEVAIEQREEIIEIGALGTITETKTVTFEYVPHHGYIIPEIKDREIVPRTSNSALSVKYTGQLVTQEIRAVFGLAIAETIEEGFTALGDFGFGGQNWALISNQGDIGWTTHALVPQRSTGAFGWDPDTNPRGTAPWLVLPGDGSAEWEGFIDSRYIPHAINPAEGFLKTANSDPIGTTFDGNPLNAPEVDGRPLYVGALYASGLRTERIDERLREQLADGAQVSLDDLATIQHDTRSSVGNALVDSLVAHLGAIADAQAPADVVAFAAGITAKRRAEIDMARTILDSWSLATPAAIEDADAAQRGDSAATTLFNVWVHFFLLEALGDEADAIGESVTSIDSNFSTRVLVALLTAPETLKSGLAAENNQPILCDDMATGEIESCSGAALRALSAALDHLASNQGFGSDDPDDWMWGALHTLTLEPLFPNNALNVPSPRDQNPAWQDGFPAPGDQFAVNSANGGYSNLGFTFGSGPAQRFLAEVEPGETIRARFALPGGVTYDSRSPHYRDLFDTYYSQQKHFDLPFLTEEVVAAGEERWLLSP